jgi:choline dehydrogenase-like flavoprotein
MISDARSIPDGTTLQTDVCVVGAGPAGITLAREFARRDVGVFIVESGGVEPDPEAQSLSAGEVTGLSYVSLGDGSSASDALANTRARGFGGTSRAWDTDVGPGQKGVRLRRLDRADFEPRDWVPNSGWPFGLEELLPFYGQADDVFGLTSLPPPNGSGGRHWFGDRSVFEETLFRFGRNDLFTDTYRLELERARDVAVIVHATVTRLETSGNGDRVAAARVATMAGGGFRVAARTFILAAGGIENARLLLVSDDVHDRGIGNENDLVGRYFMEHPHIRAGMVIPASPEAIRSFPLQTTGSVNGELIERRLAGRPRMLSRRGLLSFALTFVPVPGADASSIDPRRASPAVRSARAIGAAARRRRLPHDVLRHLRNVTSGLDDVALAGTAKLRQLVAGSTRRESGRRPRARSAGSMVLAVDAMCEQAPDPENRVTLSNELDRLGVPRARLRWRLNGLDVRTLSVTQDILRDEIVRSGLGRAYSGIDVQHPPEQVLGGHHHMGTTRMHADPRLGVVDRNCRVHGVANLYVAGSSVFPTSGYANPTFTIVALAVRLANHVAAALHPSAHTRVSGVGSHP